MLLAFGAIASSFIIVILFLSTVLSFNTLALLSLCSFIMGVIFIEGKLKTALICYFCVSLLGFLLPLDKTNLFAFILFFGYYPILKSYIERIKKLHIELLIKLLIFLLVSFLSVYGYFNFFIALAEVKLPLWWIMIFGTVFFFVLDFTLSMLFDYYFKRIRNKIRRR